MLHIIDARLEHGDASTLWVVVDDDGRRGSDGGVARRCADVGCDVVHTLEGAGAGGLGDACVNREAAGELLSGRAHAALSLDIGEDGEKVLLDYVLGGFLQRVLPVGNLVLGVDCADAHEPGSERL